MPTPTLIFRPFYHPNGKGVMCEAFDGYRMNPENVPLFIETLLNNLQDMGSMTDPGKVWIDIIRKLAHSKVFLPGCEQVCIASGKSLWHGTWGFPFALTDKGPFLDLVEQGFKPNKPIKNGIIPTAMAMTELSHTLDGLKKADELQVDFWCVRPDSGHHVLSKEPHKIQKKEIIECTLDILRKQLIQLPPSEQKKRLESFEKTLHPVFEEWYLKLRLEAHLPRSQTVLIRTRL